MNRKQKFQRLYSQLEDVAARLFGEVRRDEGMFQTGVCRLKGKPVLVINNRQSVEERIAAIAFEINKAGA